VALALLVLGLGFAISCISGLLGIGGGIVMAPALLYLPPLLGVGALDMRQVTGLTITQGLFACLSGAFRHNRHRCVSRPLVLWMGVTIALAALAGSILSSWMANETLMVVFAALALIAAVLMCFPRYDGAQVADASALPFDRLRAVLIALAVGLLGGTVGQGGSFILIPLMLYLLRLPTRVVIGSNLALVFFSSLAGFAGKLATGQIPLLLGAVLLVGAIPGAQLGSVLSQRTSPRRLRIALAVVVGLSALGIATDVFLHV
jgi:uncharacterized membrane protein YfcA